MFEFSSVEYTTDTNSSRFMWIPDFAIVMLFLQTGLRVSELVNLRLGDVSLETKELTVRQGKGRKDRVVPLVGQALEALKT